MKHNLTMNIIVVWEHALVWYIMFDNNCEIMCMLYAGLCGVNFSCIVIIFMDICTSLSFIHRGGLHFNMIIYVHNSYK